MSKAETALGYEADTEADTKEESFHFEEEGDDDLGIKTGL